MIATKVAMLFLKNRQTKSCKWVPSWNRDHDTIWLMPSWFNIDSSECLFHHKQFCHLKIIPHVSRQWKSCIIGRGEAVHHGATAGDPVLHLGYLLQHWCSRDKWLTLSVLGAISSSVAMGIIIVLVLLVSLTELLRNSNESMFVCLRSSVFNLFFRPLLKSTFLQGWVFRY